MKKINMTCSDTKQNNMNAKQAKPQAWSDLVWFGLVWSGLVSSPEECVYSQFFRNGVAPTLTSSPE